MIPQPLGRGNKKMSSEDVYVAAAPTFFFEKITGLYISGSNFRFTAISWRKSGCEMIQMPEFEGIIPCSNVIEIAGVATEFIARTMAGRILPSLIHPKH